MNKSIQLIDIDSKIPNLALMKISSYYKSIGYNVGFKNFHDPEKVYVSVIFNTNKDDGRIKLLKNYYTNSEIIIGGSGYDIYKKLDDKIEFSKPDYELYNIDYSMGYVTRGCNRSCYFCIVHKKEGKYHFHQKIEDWYNEKFDKIIFLDNNILFDHNIFKYTMDFCYDHDLKFQFNQGLDIRLLNEYDIKLILKNKHYGNINFAWDNIKDEEIIFNKIKLMLNNGFNEKDFRQYIQFYVYIDSDNDFEEGLYRVNKLKDHNINSFVMFNINNIKTKRIKNLMRWTNRKQLYWSMDFKDYL